ncbi:hypothetical protein D3C72_256100 [compost metagenome]
MKTTSAIGLVFGLLSVVPALAQTPPPAASATERPLIERLINTPFVQNWNTWGLASPPMPQAAQGVTGGKALSIDVRRAGDPWSVGAVMTNTGAVKSGDILLLGVWVRAAALPDDQATTRIPLLLLEGAAEPKPVLARATNVAVGPEWTMIYASGVAEADFAPGQTSIIMQMGQARHRLELGPALLFNFGPDYDRTRLPRNPEG